MNAEEIFNGVYQIFEKYHPNEELGLLQPLSAYLNDPNNFSNQEVYLLMIKSIVFSFTALYNQRRMTYLC
jgi:hypothetical protein